MEYKPLVVLFLVLSIISLSSAANITGIYAFGDSLFDAGNNNDLMSSCRSDHKPYGMEYPDQIASGRFSDGLLPLDFIISSLGIKKVLPAYKDQGTNHEDYPTGVTFASSCSGFDDLTSKLRNVFTMEKQYNAFEEAFETMRKNFGVERGLNVVGNALFFISGGTNDMIDNFYTRPGRKVMYSMSEYHDMLINNIGSLVKKLYNRGARKFAVVGMPPLGCLPIRVVVANTTQGMRNSVAEQNKDARSYNYKLQFHIKRWRRSMPRSKIFYADIYSPIIEMVNEPSKFGLVNTIEGCCGAGKVELDGCEKSALTCEKPSKYLFWDAANPTQAAYKVIAESFQSNAIKKLLS